jgi:hypothetical protein
MLSIPRQPLCRNRRESATVVAYNLCVVVFRASGYNDGVDLAQDIVRFLQEQKLSHRTKARFHRRDLAWLKKVTERFNRQATRDHRNHRARPADVVRLIADQVARQPGPSERLEKPSPGSGEAFNFVLSDATGRALQGIVTECNAAPSVRDGLASHVTLGALLSAEIDRMRRDEPNVVELLLASLTEQRKSHRTVVLVRDADMEWLAALARWVSAEDRRAKPTTSGLIRYALGRLLDDKHSYHPTGHYRNSRIRRDQGVAHEQPTVPVRIRLSRDERDSAEDLLSIHRGRVAQRKASKQRSMEERGIDPREASLSQLVRRAIEASYFRALFSGAFARGNVDLSFRYVPYRRKR